MEETGVLENPDLVSGLLPDFERVRQRILAFRS
jgi:hypothetical protein